GEKFNIVVVDGRNRVKCTLFAVNYLTPDGVIILDNSDRAHYLPAKEKLKKLGFRRLDFTGMTPIVGITTTTSVFYKDGNCLEI
ncbi:MAG: FkbM family methyltransferase, partial [Spirosomataceae bacterium]